MFNLTFVQWTGIYIAGMYAIAAFWFLFLERKDGFLKWRLLASALAPIAVPILFAIFIGIHLLEFTLGSLNKISNKK